MKPKKRVFSNPVTWNGIRYPTIQAAADANNVEYPATRKPPQSSNLKATNENERGNDEHRNTVLAN
jgi:hypothetical protein